jgi:hypothetical protein
MRVFTTEENVAAFHARRTLSGRQGYSERLILVLQFTVNFIPSLYLGWHHKVVNNFGVILEVEFEIEVGAGGRKTFYAGDLILAEDRESQGHIDRVWDARFLTIRLPTRALWP